MDKTDLSQRDLVSDSFEIYDLSRPKEQYFYKAVTKLELKDIENGDSKNLLGALNEGLHQSFSESVIGDYGGKGLSKEMDSILQMARYNQKAEYLSQGFNTPHEIGKDLDKDHEDAEPEIVVYEYNPERNSECRTGVRKVDIVGYLDNGDTDPMDGLREVLIGSQNSKNGDEDLENGDEEESLNSILRVFKQYF